MEKLLLMEKTNFVDPCFRWCTTKFFSHGRIESILPCVTQADIYSLFREKRHPALLARFIPSASMQCDIPSAMPKPIQRIIPSAIPSAFPTAIQSGLPSVTASASMRAFQPLSRASFRAPYQTSFRASIRALFRARLRA